MGWLREGRRGGGDEGFLELECGCWRWAIWIAECIVIHIVRSWIVFELSEPFDIGSLRFSYLCVNVFQAFQSGQLGNSIFQLQRDTKTSVRSRPLCSVLATHHVAHEAAKSE